MKCEEIKASLSQDMLRSKRVASNPKKMKEEIMKAIEVQNQLGISVTKEEFNIIYENVANMMDYE